jgi:hypothetical protein
MRALGTSGSALTDALTLLVVLVVPYVMDLPLWVWPAAVGAVEFLVIAVLESHPPHTT